MSLSSQFDNIPTPANRGGLAAMFDNSETAAALEPIPAGAYLGRAVSAELGESQKGTPHYKMTFDIMDGPHIGRRLIHRWYLSAAALPYSRRDLAALGLNSFAALERGDIPQTPVMLRVANRRDDTGGAYNEVKAVVPAPETNPRLNEAKAAIPAPAPAPITANTTAHIAVESLGEMLVDETLL